MGATLDGAPLARFRAVEVPAGGVARARSGARAPAAAPCSRCAAASTSRSTSAAAPPSRSGCSAATAAARLRRATSTSRRPTRRSRRGRPALPEALIPPLATEWEIAVLEGPHAAPDFFTDDDIADLYATGWRVHHNSSRTGVRLIGPKPRWARPDGGEAGLHPSNIHDNAYAVGTIDFTGDMPIILGPDGPSLGGFVCPATIIEADLWKIGQLKADDLVRFVPVSLEEARRRRRAQEREIETLRAAPASAAPRAERTSPPRPPRPCCRPPRARRPPGGRDPAGRRREPARRVRTAGARSRPALPRPRAHGGARGAPRPGRHRSHARDPVAAGPLRRSPPPPRAAARPARGGRGRAPRHRRDRGRLARSSTCRCPGTIRRRQLAIRKYTQSVRPDAPWCPSNIEFIRRINGLDSVDEVRRIVYDGALPRARPRRRLPGRAGGDAARPAPPPGHHQVQPGPHLDARERGRDRRRLPLRLRHGGAGRLPVRRPDLPDVEPLPRDARTSPPGQPWLLRFFDQIRFFPVGERELLAFRAAFPRGRVRLDIEETSFRFADYRAFLDENRDLDRRLSASASGRPSSPSASAGRRCRRPPRRSIRRRRAPSRRCRPARSRSAPRSPAASGRSRSPPARASPPAIG